MRYCPKCFKNLDKDYESCPICGYKEEKKVSSARNINSFEEREEEKEAFSGSVFQILDDMDSPYSYDYDEDYSDDVYSSGESNDIYANAYEQAGGSREHICQNERLENNESVLDSDAHICQNDILERQEEIESRLRGSKTDTRLIQQRLQEKKKVAMQNANRPINNSEAKAERLMAKNNKINVKELKPKNNQGNKRTDNSDFIRGFYKYTKGNSSAEILAKAVIENKLGNGTMKNASPEELAKAKEKITKNSPLFVASIIFSFINPVIGMILSLIYYSKTKEKITFIILMFICGFTLIPALFMFIFSFL